MRTGLKDFSTSILSDAAPRAVTIRKNHHMAVKRTRVRPRTERHFLGHLTLYRDDLEQIAKAVAEVGPLRIECDDWELSDPGDFADPDLPERLSRLRMVAARREGDTEIVVLLSSHGAEVTVTEPDTLTLGVLRRVQEVCDGRDQSRNAKRRRLARVAALLPLVIVALMAMVRVEDKSVALALLMGLLTLIMFIGALYNVRRLMHMSGTTATLVNNYRTERPSFWQRTRDDWIIGVVMLLLGGVLGYFVNQIT